MAEGSGPWSAVTAISGAVVVVTAVLFWASPEPPWVDSPVEFESVATYMNARYGTICDYPSHWDRDTQPENGDGTTFRDPDSQVMLTCYGVAIDLDGYGLGFSEAQEFESLTGVVEQMIRGAEGELVEQAESGTWYQQQDGHKRQIDGMRLVWRYGEEDQEMVRIDKVAVAEGIKGVASFSVPAEEYERYRDAVIKMLTGFGLAEPAGFGIAENLDSQTPGDPALTQTATLQTLSEDDRGQVQGLAIGSWIPRVSGKCTGLPAADTEDASGRLGYPDDVEEQFPNGMSEGDILAFHLALVERYDEEVLLTSQLGKSGRCSDQVIWISLINAPVVSEAEADAWCEEQALPEDECEALEITAAFLVEASTSG